MNRILSISEAPILAGFDQIDVSHISLRMPKGASLLAQLKSLKQRFSAIEHALTAEKFDAVVLEALGARNRGASWRRRLKNRYLWQLAETVIRNCQRRELPLFIHDRTDHLTLSPINRHLLKHCELYFKRELALDPWRSLELADDYRLPCLEERSRHGLEQLVQKLRPISLGLGVHQAAIIENAPPLQAWDERQWDCLIALGDVRFKPVRQILEQMNFNDSRFNELRLKVLTQPVSHPEFLRLLGGSRTCLSPSGYGWDCYRHYESLYMGALPILNPPEIRTHCHWQSGENCLLFAPWHNAVNSLVMAIQHGREKSDCDPRAHRKHVLAEHGHQGHLRHILTEAGALSKP